MKSILKKLMSVVLMTILAVSLVGCGAKPEQTAKDFLDAIKQQDIKKAASLVKDNDSKEELKYENEEQEKLVKAIFSKLEYTLGNADSKGDKGWLIDGDEQLLNAITGNICSLEEQLESK